MSTHLDDGILAGVVEVRAVAPSETYPLRQEVLRPHQQVEDLVQDDDEAPDSGSFAAFDQNGQVVGTGVVGRRAPPWLPCGTGWQLRGMAVAPDLRGRGVGSAVLGAILDHVRDRGGGLVWCNARIPARNLYERAGFETVGEPFELELIGRHVRMARRI